MSHWTGKRVAVTGAGGFIGSHLVEALAGAGADVEALVRYNSRGERGWLADLPDDASARVRVTFGDLRDPSTVKAFCREADVVFHLGALIAIPYSYVHPSEVVETNVMGTVNVLEALRERPQAVLVHTSTSEVYGTAQTERIAESHPLQGQSPYSASKIGADKIVESYTRSFGIRAVTVRPFNTYGPRQSARAVIPTIITQALASERVRLGSVRPIRDFTYVADTVRGFMLAAGSEAAFGTVVNLGANDEISIGALVEAIGALLGRRLTVEEDAARVRPDASEVLRLRSDNALARTLIGWQPEVPLRDGLARTIEWIQRHMDRFRVGEYAV